MQKLRRAFDVWNIKIRVPFHSGDLLRACFGFESTKYMQESATEIKGMM